MPTKEDIINVATWLLDRPLMEQDGVTPAECAAAERRLGCSVPTALREFYLAVGRQSTITSSFQRSIEPDKWTMYAGKIVFLEENQGVCYWATDRQSKVYQTTYLEEPEWYEEPLDLSEFLRVLLYYQMVQGGYPFCGMMPAKEFSNPDELRAFIGEMGAQKIVDTQGLKIHAVSDQALVWYLHNDGTLVEPGLFLSALYEEPFRRICDHWSFDDLG